MKPIRLGLVLALALAAPLWADTIEGSATIHRTFTDSSSGQVYLYAGGSFDAGDRLTTFTWLNDNGHVGYMTPILFEQTSPGVYTVRGVGENVSPVVSGSVQSAAFTLAYGTDVTTNGNFTFGWINAQVDSSGNQAANSAGTVDWNEFADGLPGVGGPGTTDTWFFTPTDSGINVALGTTFYTPGNSGNFNLNNPAFGGFNSDRTYSATMSVVDTPEPGTMLMLGSGLTTLAGVVRRRRKA